MIKLQFSRSTELVSLLIAKACRSKFSHVDAVLEDGNLLGASDSPKVPVIAGNPSGVAIRTPDYQDFAIRRMAHIYVPTRVEARFYDILHSQLGEPFDNTAMHRVFNTEPDPGQSWKDQDGWFCSELKAYSAEEAGVFDVPPIISMNKVTPSDFLLMISHLVANAETFWNPIPGLVLGEGEI